MTKVLKRAYLFMVAALMIISFIFCDVAVTAYADDGKSSGRSSSSDVVLYDDTKIADDLSDMDMTELLKLTSLSPCVVRFSEYGYSDKASLKLYYGLYMYVYDPTGKEIYEYGNVANMGVTYNEKGQPTAYNNVRLTLLDSWRIGNNTKGTIYKFKVADSYAFLEQVAKYYDPDDAESARRYDIAGIQLRWKSGDEKMDHTYGRTYYFKGYAKGCIDVSTEENQLTSTYDALETIDLEPKHTYYRTNAFNENYECDELDTVYFGVPKEYFADSFKLKQIKAQWYEDKSQRIFVTDDAAAYNAIKPYIGKEIGQSDDSLRYRVLFEETDRPILGEFENKLVEYYNLGKTWHEFAKTYNGKADGDFKGASIGEKAGFSWGTEETQYVSVMNWLMQVAEADQLSDYNLTSEMVRNYMEWYTASFPEREKLEAGKDAYAKDLFAGWIDEDRLKHLDARKDGSDPDATSGWITQEIDAEEMRESSLISAEPSFWDFIFNREVEQWTEKCKAIEVLDETAGIKNMSVSAFAEKYFINDADAKDVYDYCVEQLDNGNYPVLFRFAQTKYYASAARFDAVSAENFPLDEAGDMFEGCDWVDEQDGYVARETMFLGFDVISLRFQDNGNSEKIIAVVADPFDIINGLDAPTDLKDKFDGDDIDWERVLYLILGGLLLIGILVIAAPILPAVGNGLIFVLQLPFKGLALLFKAIGNLFHKKE